MALLRDFVDHLKDEHDLSVDDKELESLLAGNKEYMKMFLFIRANLISKKDAENCKAEESKHRNYQRLLQLRSEVDKCRQKLKHLLNVKINNLQTNFSLQQRRERLEYKKYVLQNVQTGFQNTFKLNVSQTDVQQFLQHIQDAIKTVDFDYKEAELDSIRSHDSFVKTTSLELEMEKTIKQINQALHFIHLNRVYSYDEVNVDEKFAEHYLNAREPEQHTKSLEHNDSALTSRLGELKKLLEIYKSRRLHIEENVVPKVKNVLAPLQSNQSINVL